MSLYTHAFTSSICARSCAGYKSSSGRFANALNSALNMRTISSDSLETTRLVCVSNSTGTVKRTPGAQGPAASYRSRTKAAPITGSGTHPSHGKLPLLRNACGAQREQCSVSNATACATLRAARRVRSRAAAHPRGVGHGRVALRAELPAAVLVLARTRGRPNGVHHRHRHRLFQPLHAKRHQRAVGPGARQRDVEDVAPGCAHTRAASALASLLRGPRSARCCACLRAGRAHRRRCGRGTRPAAA
jgi:hypothetical protein